jgi:hypothetical protein
MAVCFARALAVALALFGIGHVAAATQTVGEPEEFTAVAIANDNLASGAGTVQIRITRWSTEVERQQLVDTLLSKGPEALLGALRETRSVGTIRTPDSIGYELHYAQQARTEEGGRRLVIATDRPIGFWEAWNRPRMLDYPFTIIQMQLDRDGKGQGSMSYATRVIAHDKTIELENYTSSPVMLTQIEAQRAHN